MFKRFSSQAWISSDSEGSDGAFPEQALSDDSDNLSQPDDDEKNVLDVASASSLRSNVADSSNEKEDSFTVGKYHCRLCPKRILFTEKMLNRHLLSKGHLSRQKAWESQSNVDSASLFKAVSSTENQETKPKRIASARLERRAESKRKRLEEKKAQRVASLTPEEILRRKQKFQLKKNRRLTRQLAATSK